MWTVIQNSLKDEVLKFSKDPQIQTYNLIIRHTKVSDFPGLTGKTRELNCHSRDSRENIKSF